MAESSAPLSYKRDSVTAGLSWDEFKRKKKERKKWKEEAILKKLKSSKDIEPSKNPQEAVNDCVNKTRYTVSIALPGSIIDNAQSTPLKTYLAGQIARAAAIFRVNEIVVFDETATASELAEDDEESLKAQKKFQGCFKLLRILQYLECPQYLRHYYFPLHKDLEYAGLLNPLDLPHHLRVDDVCEYREGTVLDKPVKAGKGSFVYIGLKKTAIIDHVLETNVRVTVKLDQEQMSKKHFRGKAVSPSAPFRESNLYWGYSVRFASSLKGVFSNSPFKGNYDCLVGTSDKGDNVDTCKLKPFKHLLVVFGGLGGLESGLDADQALVAQDPRELFDYYVNACPDQGSRIIRTEEAILITLAALRPHIARNNLQ